MPLYFAAYVVLGFGFSIIGPSLPTLRENAGATNGEISILFPAISLGGLCGAVFAGALYDRKLGHRLFGIGVAGFGLASLALAVPTSVALLAAAAFSIGLAGSAIDVGGNTLLLWRGGGRLTFNMNILHLMFGFGALSAPLVVDLSLRQTDGLFAGFVPVAVIGGVLGATIFFGPTAPAPTHESEGGNGPIPTLVQLGAIALFYFVYVGAEVGFGGWVYSYAEGTGRGATGAAYVTATFWSAFTLCRLVVALIGNRATPAQVLFASGSIAVFGSAVLLLSGDSVLLVFLGAGLVGAGVAPQFPTMLLFAGRRIQTSGRSMSVFLGAAGIGAATLPWLMGQVIDSNGTDTLPLLALIAMLATMSCTILVSTILPPPRPGR